jgi:archaellum component FlaC
MKKRCIAIVFSCLSLSITHKATAQSEEAQQLLLNVEKLAQLKEILKNLYKSYEVISIGYNTIKDLSQGNFNLHKNFLDNLMQVSPVVKNYKKVADIIACQLKIVSEYKQAYNRFKSDKNFSSKEMEYMGKVYSNLFNQSLKNVDALVTIVTAGTLRMSDNERLEAVDNLYDDMQDKLSFLRHFNNNTTVLAVQRAKEKNDINTIQSIYGINK